MNNTKAVCHECGFSAKVMRIVSGYVWKRRCDICGRDGKRRAIVMLEVSK